MSSSNFTIFSKIIANHLIVYRKIAFYLKPVPTMNTSVPPLLEPALGLNDDTNNL